MKRHRVTAWPYTAICLIVPAIGCGPIPVDTTKNDGETVPRAKAEEPVPVAVPPKQQTTAPAVGAAAAGTAPVAATAPDPKLIEELYKTKNVATLKELLNQNKAGADKERREWISQIAGPIEEIRKIPKKDGAYYIVIASRMHPLFKSAAGAPPQIAIAFDEAGRIQAAMGGDIAPDGANGDTIEFVDLGTLNSWFVIISRFERHGIYPEQTDVYLVKDQFPRALRVHDFKFAYSAKLEGAARFEKSFLAFIRKADQVPQEQGIGRDGKKHPLPIYWDAEKGVFRGPSHMTLNDVDYFDVVISESHAFEPIDVPGESDQ